MYGRWRASARTIVVAVMALAVGLAVRTGSANHQFSDVPTLANYHEAASWLATRAVTLGCASGLYCPNDFVTRGQMALFMNRLGKTLSPRFLHADQFLAGLDPDANPVVCQTGTYTPSAPQRALVHGYLHIFPAGALTIGLRVTRSADNGATWIATQPSRETDIGSTGEGPWMSAGHVGWTDLQAGTNYRFGIEVTRGSGVSDITSAECILVVQITNRNPDGENPELASPAVAPARRR